MLTNIALFPHRRQIGRRHAVEPHREAFPGIRLERNGAFQGAVTSQGLATLTAGASSIIRVTITPFTKGFTFTNYSAGIPGLPFLDSAYVWYGLRFPLPSSDDPRLNVNCGGAPRGGTVACTAALTRALPFTIVMRSATGARYNVTDNTPVNVPAGGSHTWSGTAVASAAQVLMTAVVTQNGVTKRVTNEVPAFFTVTRRTWPVWNVNTGRE